MVDEMSEENTATEPAPAKSHAAKYTRNQPYMSQVLVNDRLTGPDSEKETIHIEMALEEGMTYTPGDAVGIVPTNREAAVAEVLQVLGYTGAERVLDHYKVEISLEEALRTRLGIGKLARGSLNQFAKLCGDNVPAGLKCLLGAENKPHAEEYVWGREFVDLAKEFPGIVTEPQQLFNILQRLTPRMYSIASSQASHPNEVHTTVRVVRYTAHGADRQGICSGHLGERAPAGVSHAHLPA